MLHLQKHEEVSTKIYPSSNLSFLLHLVTFYLPGIKSLTYYCPFLPTEKPFYLNDQVHIS